MECAVHYLSTKLSTGQKTIQLIDEALPYVQRYLGKARYVLHTSLFADRGRILATRNPKTWFAQVIILKRSSHIDDTW
jgi:hypothetical protein